MGDAGLTSAVGRLRLSSVAGCLFNPDGSGGRAHHIVGDAIRLMLKRIAELSDNPLEL